MTPENDERLCKKYPKIFKSRGGTMQETCMYWGLAVGDGWYDLIDTLCGCLQNHADNEKTEKAQAVAAQVKEKFGGLRFYIDGGDDVTDGMVRMAEHMSYCICEDCGNKATVRTRGYIRSLCGGCATKQKALWGGDKK
jgi:hypothetical protein